MKEDNTNMEKNTNESGQIKKSFLDFNFSWIMLVIDLALIFGLGTLNLNVMQQHSLAIQSTLYIVIVVGVSLIANFLFYTLGKLIGGLIGGYQVTKVVFLGMTIIFKHDGKDNDVSFKVNNILDFHLVMTPKKEKTCHYGYLLGGMVGYILINVVALLLALLVFSGDKIISYSILFGIGYGFIVALYELFPCRLDYVNDCFILIKTTHKEDLLAYENELKNIRHSLLGEDLEIIEFGGQGAVVEAVRKGAVDAGIVFSPHFSLAKKKLRSCGVELHRRFPARLHLLPADRQYKGPEGETGNLQAISDRGNPGVQILPGKSGGNREDIRRQFQAGPRHCPRGHLYRSYLRLQPRSPEKGNRGFLEYDERDRLPAGKPGRHQPPYRYIDLPRSAG